MAKNKRFHLSRNVSVLSIMFIIIVVMLLAIFTLMIHNDTINTQVNTNQATLAADQKTYNQRFNSLNKNYKDRLLNTNNEKAGSILQNQKSADTTYKNLNEFFQIFYTYDNDEQFLARPKVLREAGLISPNYADNQKVFGKQGNRKTKDKVKSMGIQSKLVGLQMYDNPNSPATIKKVRVIVTYATKYSQNGGDNVDKMGDVLYNTKTNQVMSYQPIVTVGHSLVTKWNQ
ncbi:hypothetical protein [Fructilactobacillus fructivorans]|uniref:Uncharacterized protein n=1 Tax=Fructilactobacillus fructivorans TaxID=1614 RepID=A0A0C1Q3C5_9LACO|nr:hypothetical protein [Fructilactobacillus fructivorans]KID42378.1 hypothetical protein LfDm3_0307 [Fructilactobacillus fructivorans]MCT0151005.1 hypothetical protein [Fructilactobacillus fructivorans]MCT2867437.1 hypothetical protein [Fructilactobacillus fructivorans]MCT2869044.1 hypothetical protein [Fructilactobacillus fructivorans]MCT2873236.1 hypothetical protein [Fructilactobacillus fructivorans]